MKKFIFNVKRLSFHKELLTVINFNDENRKKLNEIS